MDYHSMSVEEAFKQLSSSAAGLDSAEVRRRHDRFGKNALDIKPPVRWLAVLLRQFNSPMIWILMAAVVVSVFVGEAVDAAVIGTILVLNALLGFFQEFRAERSIAALERMTSPKADVLRDGKRVKIDATDLVPGDIIFVETGDRVPADCRIMESFCLEVQEATLTGESVPAHKSFDVVALKSAVADRMDMLFAGTIITKGRGQAVVCATGMSTELGKIANMIQKSPMNLTPLQRQLVKLGRWLGVATLMICCIVFIVGLFAHEGTFLVLFMTAVALAVAAIPEGLPAVVTISLSLGVQRMLKKNALMRHLPSVETLGCTTVICTDKTGTLTKNEMTVRHIFANGKDVSVEGSGYLPEGRFSSDPSAFSLLLRIGALNNDAQLDKKDWSVMGDPTEACLLTSALKAGLDFTELRKSCPRVDEIPFDEKSKRMITVHKVDGRKVAYVKGAADILIDSCSSVYESGKIVKMMPEKKKEILKQSELYADSALRVLGFAYKELRPGDGKDSYGSDLVFVGLQAMMDPPREEVKPAIAKCRTAGIKVVMITGDLKQTAEAIARELGIPGKSMSGTELDAMSDSALESVVESVGVYARVNPEHKLRIVNALKKRGHVVAMTGDGVNDAPAIKSADIGIAMGITGTDVAKEACEMVLADDDFTSIVAAVEEGRGIYDNIRKFVNYLLSCNIGEVLVVFAGSLIGLPLPLLAVHLLWINLVTDGLPAIALGVDPVSSDAMKRPPRKLSDRIMSRSMSLNVFSLGAIMAFAVLMVYWLAQPFGVTVARTLAFTTLVMMEIVRLEMIRRVYSSEVFSNKWLNGAVLLSVLLQLAVLYTPLNIFLDVVPLTFIHWLFVAGALVVVWLLGTVATTLIKRATNEMY